MKIRRSSTKSARSRSGISLVEVIVALAVITIISTAALSLVISSARVDANSLRSTRVMIAAENALECYRFSDSEDEFVALLRKTGDYIEADGSYVLTESSYAITVEYEDDSLRFTAIDSDGKEIYNYEFYKGK